MPPVPGNQRPSLSGYAEAQDRKRLLLGSPVTFLWPAHVTFPPSTPVNADGAPYDPTVLPASSSAASASAVASVFFKAINRGGAAGAEIASPIGHLEHTRLFLNLASGDGRVIQGLEPVVGGNAFAGFGEEAVEFEFHGDRYKIYAIKDDEIMRGYRRTLVYGAAIGADDDSGFSP
jgi:hypothetical protein